MDIENLQSYQRDKELVILNHTNNLTFQNLASLLQTVKNLEVIDKELFQIGDLQYLRVKGRSQEYTILIASLNEKGIFSQEKLEKAQQQAKLISQINHPNVLGYCEEFQIDNYYFILLQTFRMSIHNLIQNNNQSPINQELFVRISLELLQTAQYLLENGFYIKDLYINSIFLDENLSIKICSIGQIDEYFILQKQQLVKENLSDQINSDDILSTPPEYLFTESKKNILGLGRYRINIWEVGIFLYMLAGASYESAVSYIKGEEPFQIQQNLSQDINLILINILQRSGNARPSFPEIIQSFLNVSNISQRTEQNYIQLLLLSLQYYNNDQFDEAEPIFKRLIEINPNHELIYFKLAYIYQQKDQLDLAIFHFKRAIELNKNYDKACLNLGNSYRKQKNYGEALFYQNKVKEINPLCNAEHEIGRIYSDMGLDNEAINSFQKSIENNIMDDFSYFQLGFLYDKQKQYDKAIFYYKKYLELDPNNKQGNLNIGYSYIENNMFEEAIYFLKIAEQKDPGNYEIQTNLGYGHFKLQKNEEAIHYYRQAISLNINNRLDCYDLLAKVYKSLKNYDEQINVLKEAIEINDSDSEILSDLGDAYYNKKMYEESICYYTKAINLNPNSAMLYQNLGLAYFSMEDIQESKQQLMLALKIDNKLKRANILLGYLIGLEEDQHKAIIYFKGANKIDNDLIYFMQQSIYLMNLSNIDLALSNLIKGVKRCKYDPNLENDTEYVALLKQLKEAI